MNENEQLKHRLACIKRDIEIISQHIQRECSDVFCQPSHDVDGNVYAEQAWHNISNVEIACDLTDDSSIEWQSDFKTNRTIEQWVPTKRY